ncbi:MAG TPA: VWA domain-containing protein [bacterium]
MKNSKGAADFFCKIIKIVIFILILHNYLTTIMYALESKNVMTRSLTLDSLILIYNDVNALTFPKIVSLVTVTNDAGFIVGKLDENNFIVQEDNTRELPILVEELASGVVGINVALTIDRSGSMRGQPITDAKNAASSFVGLMQKDDQSAVVSFANQPRTDHLFTSDVDSLKAAIARIQSNGGTAIFDALIHSVYLMNNSLKNRAIILLTDGADRDSQASYADALATVQSYEVRVFTIGLGLAQGSPEENILKDLASKTGGLYFYSPTSAQLEEIYRAISQLLHHRYRITYSTHNPAKDGTLRHVQVDVAVNTATSKDTANYRAPYEAPPIDPPDDPVIPPDSTFEVIPNPFTPNEDGFNDWTEFRKGSNIPQEWVITILDRAGRQVRQLHNGDRIWNGKDESGQIMLPGCYLYLVSSGKKIIYRGLIQLIR